ADRRFTPFDRGNRRGSDESFERTAGEKRVSRLLLASASASRQALLRAAGVDFVIAPASINEPALMQDLIAKGSEAGIVAEMLAEQKAVMVSRRSPGEIVL